MAKSPDKIDCDIFPPDAISIANQCNKNTTGSRQWCISRQNRSGLEDGLLIDRKLQIRNTIFLTFVGLSGTNVQLYRRNLLAEVSADPSLAAAGITESPTLRASQPPTYHQLWQSECSITLSSPLHKFFLTSALLDVNVLGPLLCDGGLEAVLTAIGSIIVAHKHTNIVWQRQNALNRFKQGRRRSSRKVTTGRTHVGHENLATQWSAHTERHQLFVNSESNVQLVKNKRQEMYDSQYHRQK